jgi:RNase adaptor protein for sRNA GlmZ degradation
VFVLVRNQHPRYVDVIGSGFTEKRRPAPLQPKHVLQALVRERENLAKLAPEDLQVTGASEMGSTMASHFWAYECDHS